MSFENSQYVRFVSENGNDWDTDHKATTTIDRRSLSDDVWDITGATGIESDGGTLAWFVTTRRSGREEIRVGFGRVN